MSDGTGGYNDLGQEEADVRKIEGNGRVVAEDEPNLEKD